MPKKLLFVFNARAGKSHISDNLCEIINVFTAGGYEVTAYPTQCRLDAFQKIKDRAGDFDMIVASGGDGTLSEAIKGLMNSRAKPLIGYIPAGTVNDFARSMDIPRNMVQAAQNVLNGTPFALDIGSFNGEFYSYVAAFGAFTDVSYETPQSTKNLLGHLAYFLEGIKRINKLEAYDITVEHDGEVIRDDFVAGLITNSRTIGGLKNLVANGVIFDDGKFEVTLVKMPNSPLELQGLLAKIVMGDLNSKYFVTFKTSNLRVTCDSEIAWTLDGESGGSYTVAEIQNHKRALNIIIPREDKSDV